MLPILQGEGESFGLFVRRLMVAKGLRSNELAELAGISTNALSHILNGRAPSWESASALMRALGIRLIRPSDDAQASIHLAKLIADILHILNPIHSGQDPGVLDPKVSEPQPSSHRKRLDPGR